MTLTLRVRGPGGQATLAGLDPATPLPTFLARVEAEAGVAAGRGVLLAGFPPAPVELPADADAATLADLGLATGDMLVVREGPPPTAAAAAATTTAAASPSPAAAGPDWGALAAPDGMTEDEALAAAIAASLEGVGGGGGGGGAGAAANQTAPPPPPPRPPRPSSPPARRDVATLASTTATASAGGAPTFAPVAGDPRGAVVARRVVAADNSCLFAAVGYALAGGRAAAASLRAVCAAAVRGDPGTWSEPVLGKAPAEYAAWISDPVHWGGGIELAILAAHFAVEIAAHDVATERVDTYGTGAGYGKRVLLIYDGLHYDALALAPGGPSSPEAADATVFDVTDPGLPAVMAAAAAVAGGLRAARQFTDTARFTLRCGVCGAGVVGEADAVAHAKATGHGNFQEY